MRILLIEPDNVLANIYRAAFERAGHKVARVKTAQAAITVADIRTPDVVVLEMQLACHSGAAFLYEFRTYADWLSIPVVINTVIPPTKMMMFEESLKELGVHTCLYKPHTNLRKLVQAIDNAVVTAQ
jgi:DNA-binding response OmpR family regulator